MSGVIRIWDTINKEHVLKFEMRALGGRVNDLDWTEDSKRIVCVGEGREFFGRAFFFDTGASVGEISGSSKNLISCSIKQNRPYRLATGGEDFDVNHFNGVPFKWQRRVDSKSNRFINAVRYAPSGELYAVGSSAKLIELFDGKSGDRIGELPQEHKGGVYSLSWSEDGSKLLSASGDKTCKLWDVEAKKCISTFTFGQSTLDQQYGTLWQGEHLLSVSLSGHINYLDVNNPSKPLRVLHGHQKFVTSLSYDADKDDFYTGSYDSVLTRWDASTGATQSFEGKGHSSQINGIAVQNGNVVTASMDSSLRITDLGSMEYGASFGTDTDAVGVATGVKNNSLIVGVSLDGIIKVSSGGAAAAQVKKQPIDYEGRCVALSVCETQIAVGGGDNCVHVYQIEGDQFKEIQTLKGPRGKINDVRFSPDGKWLASCDHARDIYVWSTADWSVKHKTWGSFHTAAINGIAWTPDSLHLASAGLDQNLFVWTIGKRAKRIKIERAHQGGANKVAWVSNTVLASVGQDNALKTWDVVHFT